MAMLRHARIGRCAAYLDEILRLDPVADHKRIVHLHVCCEFPFDTTRSPEFALFRTFAVPSIAGLLHSSGEFERRPQKRYDDTDILISAMLEHGYDSELGRRALRRMNQIHRRFEISNEDFVYVLSSFVLEPIRWIQRFGWRPLTEHERLGLFHCWRAIGRRMNIREIPSEIGELERYNVEYERAQFGRTDASARLAITTRDLFLGWFPFVPHRLGAQAIYALVDPMLAQAVGFPRPRANVVRAVEGGLRARSRAVRLLPPRRRPRLRTARRPRTYREGYRIDELGPAV
jgi:hypothetical protein